MGKKKRKSSWGDILFQFYSHCLFCITFFFLFWNVNLVLNKNNIFYSFCYWNFIIYHLSLRKNNIIINLPISDCKGGLSRCVFGCAHVNRSSRWCCRKVEQRNNIIIYFWIARSVRRVQDSELKWDIYTGIIYNSYIYGKREEKKHCWDPCLIIPGEKKSEKSHGIYIHIF